MKNENNLNFLFPLILSRMKKIIQFMFKRKVWPFILIITFTGVFLAFRSNGEGGKGTTNQEKILTSLTAIIKENHYDPKPIDNDFSKEVFKRYLNAIDPDKNIFLQSDLKALKKFELSIDDEMNGATIQLVPAVNEMYAKRIHEVADIYKQILAKPFDYNVDETVIMNADKLEFATNEVQRKDMWRKKLKYLTLERYSDLLDQREKNKDKKDYKAKTDLEIEAEARTKVVKMMDKSFDRLRYKFTDDERFNIFVNTITNYMDPHSDYFPPVEKRGFDEQMSGKFFGIGASLKEEESNIKVATLITGSPAWKSGEVKVGDIVIKVAQGKDEPVDVSGFAVTDAVTLIRGNKGTEVRLTLKQEDGTIKVVSLIRDEIVLDESYVRSAIINGKEKVGYIYLQDFYADFEKPNGARCAQDVARELLKLKAENVEGVILDLRGNGGGYLIEAINLVGLFIPEGPVVQVKEREGKPTVMSDNNKAVIYSGPLAVMINETSASASEIFAAAIQDYGRGIIIGSSSSFGKGTVQRNIPFGRPVDMYTGRTEYGAIKLTLQKYYRINGGSTQLKGVTPDIILPDEYEFMKFKEKDNPNSLPWDEIAQSSYTPWSSPFDLKTIQASSVKRIADNPSFNLIRTNAEWLGKQNDKMYSLSLAKYQEEQKRLRATLKQNDDLSKLKTELTVVPLAADKAKYDTTTNKDKAERYKAWLKFVSTDIYIDEATKVVNDMIVGSITKVATNQ